MNRLDHTPFEDWLNLEADGCLPREEHAELEEHLVTCPECRAERQELAALSELLVRSRIEVRPDFRDKVMAALPAAGWESRYPRAWGLPAAVCLLLGAIAAFLLGSSPTEAGGSGLRTVLAVAEMFQATALAGAGMLAASWKSWGLILEQKLASPVSLGAFFVLVVCLNLLLISLVRRRRLEAPASR